MKITFMKSTSWNNEIESSTSPVGLSDIDGQTLTGQSGVLRIALHPTSLRVSRDEASPSHWLLPLNDVEMVRLSANLPGNLLWLSPRKPEAVAGLLVGDFRGAWWQEQLAVLQLLGETEAYILPASHPGPGSLAVLADIVARRWSGQSQEQVHTALLRCAGAANGKAPESSTPAFQLAVA